MVIDNHVMEILNKKYCRKRMINIFYLIKKILQEMGCEKYKLVYLKISPQTMKSGGLVTNHSFVKEPINNPS